MDKRSPTERDICTKFLLPAVKRVGRDGADSRGGLVHQGWIIARGKLVTRGKAKKADFVLYYKPNIPIALIEAKDYFDDGSESRRSSTTESTTTNWMGGRSSHRGDFAPP